MLFDISESAKLIAQGLDIVNTKNSIEFEFRFNCDATFFYKFKNEIEKICGCITVTLNDSYLNSIRKRVTYQVDKPDCTEYTRKESIFQYPIKDYDFNICVRKEEAVHPETFKSSQIVKSYLKTRYIFDFEKFKIDMTMFHGKYNIELEIKKGCDYPQIIDMLYYILKIKQDNFIIISNTEQEQILLKFNKFMKKKHGPLPYTLHKNQLSDLYQKNYAVTGKLDGSRHLLFIDENSRVYSIDSNFEVKKTDLICKSFIMTVLDCERTVRDSKVVYHAFDLLVYNGAEIRNNKEYTLLPRLELLNQVIQDINKFKNPAGYYSIILKKYIFYDVFNGSRILFDEKIHDGLIFVPMDECFPTTKSWKTMLKWKPEKENTIDFYSVKMDSQEDYDIWNLYVSVPTTEKGKNEWSHALFDINAFTGEKSGLESFKTKIPKELVKTKKLVSETVIEYYWDKTSCQFVPIRTRWDKSVTGKANFASVALDIWSSIFNPVNLQLLSKFTKFTENHNYDNYRKSISYSKNSLKSIYQSLELDYNELDTVVPVFNSVIDTFDKTQESISKLEKDNYFIIYFLDIYKINEFMGNSSEKYYEKDGIVYYYIKRETSDTFKISLNGHNDSIVFYTLTPEHAENLLQNGNILVERSNIVPVKEAREYEKDILGLFSLHVYQKTIENFKIEEKINGLVSQDIQVIQIKKSNYILVDDKTVIERYLFYFYDKMVCLDKEYTIENYNDFGLEKDLGHLDIKFACKDEQLYIVNNTVNAKLKEMLSKNNISHTGLKKIEMIHTLMNKNEES
jgi:hypothetical protein